MLRATGPRIAGLLAAVLAGHSVEFPAASQVPPASEFVGTTLCGPEVRAFIGGLPGDAPCHAITWRLTVKFSTGPAHTWQLAAKYGVPARTNPNAMVEGPAVSLQGTWRALAGTRAAPAAAIYRLTREGAPRPLSFAAVHTDLLHLLSDDGTLMVGDGGWSYTLNRAARAEQPGEISRAPDMSYTISPLATGPAVFGVFEGRTPCRGISRQLKLPEIDGCLKVKWRVTLYRDPSSAAATSYKIESSLHRQRAREGTWKLLRQSSAGSDSEVYHLDATATEGAIRLLKGDDNVLFFVDERFSPLIGTADFSYTLNRVLGRTPEP
jgi:hypothetical protein